MLIVTLIAVVAIITSTMVKTGHAAMPNLL
jgi:hypothetical protein